ncbi:hypothetical protein LEP1GSC194_1419 [Leptospira alstonii serovar Sichuan str. 79601]|uniref:Uncharacterized protein n=1 Tax=Leptospira alstonii serovar Sichuan str. 79601 TaxID=1218565 RepID=M6CRH0_9LEPT|nr:hypothetical protein LEP1GSC194_1419 [Leptospira alstonii serovar Sichuan str. 79601]
MIKMRKNIYGSVGCAISEFAPKLSNVGTPTFLNDEKNHSKSLITAKET